MLSDSTIDELTGQCHLLWWFPLVSRGGGGACLCVCAPLCLLTLLVSPVPFNPDASHFHHNCAGSRLVTQITSALCERFSRSTWHTYRRPDGWPFTGTLTHAPNCEPVTVRTLSRHARNAGQITLGGSETSVACPQEQAATGRSVWPARRDAATHAELHDERCVFTRPVGCEWISLPRKTPSAPTSFTTTATFCSSLRQRNKIERSLSYRWMD